MVSQNCIKMCAKNPKFILDVAVMQFKAMHEPLPVLMMVMPLLYIQSVRCTAYMKNLYIHPGYIFIHVNKFIFKTEQALFF